MSRILEYETVVDIYPNGSTLYYEIDPDTINYVTPIVAGSTYTITMNEIGNRLRIVTLFEDPRELTSNLTKGVTSIINNPTYDVGYTVSFTANSDGYVVIYVSNQNEHPKVTIETDGIGGDDSYSHHNACVVFTSGTNLSLSTNSFYDGYALATVSTRSDTIFTNDWELVRESNYFYASDGTKQKMFFLKKRVKKGDRVTLSFSQAISKRAHINITVFESCVGILYHEGNEFISNEEITEAIVKRSGYEHIVWGCSAITWRGSAPYGNWKCDNLPCISINQVSNPPRQANFIDSDYSISERKFTPIAGTACVIDCVEILFGQPRKYLIKSNGIIYTIVDDVLTQIDGTTISEEMFTQYGFEFIPTWENIKSLNDPEIMMFSSSSSLLKLKARMKAIPFPQSIVTDKVFLTHSSITGIESALATCEGELIVAVSFDEKQTWKAWNGEQWATLSDSFTGMNKETFESITFEQWNLLYTGSEGFYLRVSLIDDTQSVAEIYIDFSN